MAPLPVDLSRLTGVLKKAQVIMAKVENEDFSTGHINEDRSYGMNEGVVMKASPKVKQQPQQFSEELVENSALPAFLKESFKKQPPLTNMSNDYSVPDDLLYEKPMPFPGANPRKQQIKEQRVVSSSQGMINESEVKNIVRNEVKDIIKEEVLSFMNNFFINNLKEETKKETIKQIQAKYKLTKK